MYIHYTRSVSYYCNGFAQHRFVSSPERVVVTKSPYIHDMEYRELPVENANTCILSIWIWMGF